MTIETDIKKINNQVLNLDIVDLSVENKAIEIIDKNPLYYDNLKIWYAFDKVKKQWKKVDEVDIISFIKKTYSLYGLSNTQERTTLLNALKDEARYRKPLSLNDFQIQIGKYIYDIRNNNVIEASQKYLPNTIIDKDIETVGEDEECLLLDKLFVDWVGDEKQVLYDIIAFCMSPKYFLDVCFWFVGKGENGKGLFTSVINNIIGFENVTSQDLETLSDPKDRFTKGFLRNKLVCGLGDGNPQVITHTKALKTLAGCTDMVRGEIKGGGQVDFYNRAKLIGAFNTLPETSDKTDGFYRRQHMTEFKNNFSGMKNPLPDITEREYVILAKICFDRLKVMYKDNILTGWGNLEDRKAKYERLSNPISLFIKEELTQDEEMVAFLKTLHDNYMRFAIKKGYNSFTKKEFESRLINQGYIKTKKDVYTHNGFCWGKRNKIPKDIYNSKPEDEWETTKLTVFYGLGFKFLDPLDPIEPKFELEIPRKDIKLKSESIGSKRSIFEDLIRNFDQNKEFLHEDLTNKGLDDDFINELKKEGVIYEPKRGMYKLL